MEWARGPTIGRGATATVSLGTTLSSGELFAVKSCELSNSMFLRREQSVLSQLSHDNPHVVKYMGFDSTVENSKHMYNLFVEYVPGGTLHEGIQRQGGKLNESLMKLYAHQILLGLHYLHSNGVAHCDVKSQNVLLSENGQVAKICDFGCARIVGNGVQDGSAFSGTPMFMAPEVARGEEQGFKADIWALGCTFLEMARGSQPMWHDINDPVKALFKIGFTNELPQLPSNLSDKARDFVRKCLARDPKQRWGAKELLGHPFFDQMFTLTMNTPSPCCVLDSGFWDSIDSLDTTTSHNPIRLLSDSPQQRIMSLVHVDAPIWSDFEEDWTIVRSICTTNSDHAENNVMMAVNHNYNNNQEELEVSLVLDDDDFSSVQRIENFVSNNTSGRDEFVLQQNIERLIIVTIIIILVSFQFHVLLYFCLIHFLLPLNYLIFDQISNLNILINF